MIRHALFALTLLILVVMGTALSHSRQQRLDRVMTKLMQCGNIPAAAVALVGRDSSVTHFKTFVGPHNSETSRRISEKTQFCLGEATQAFTAVMLARLMQRNGSDLTWTTPIEELVNHRVELSENYRSRKLSLKDVFAQRSGYPDMDIVSFARPFPTVRRLTRQLRYVQPVAEFRDKFVPNQVLFSLLHDVIRMEGGATWENLMEELVFKPLDMKSVVYLGGDTKVDIARPVVFDRNRPARLDLYSLKGLNLLKESNGLCMTGRDMSKWLRFLLDGLDASRQKMMEMDELGELFKGVQSRGGGDNPAMAGYKLPGISYSREQQGLGWISGHYKDYGFVSQDGSLPGSHTLSTVLPDEKMAVMTSFVGKGGLAAKSLINMYGLDLLLNQRPWFNETDVCHHLREMERLEPVKDAPRRTQRLERPLEDYAGHYSNYAFGRIHIQYNSTGTENLIMEYGDASFNLLHLNANDTFQLSAIKLWFTTNSDTASKVKKIATFAIDPSDPDHRIRDVVISGFASEDVVFSTHPVPPRYEGYFECQCDVASSMTSLVSLMLTSLLVCAFTFFR